ncbi:MAG TPA: quinone oxidoreductase, partial [Polyangiaceae bacterium]|nr:quinone oxidoreductase [Polyangiaceae bacterium]
QTGTPDVLAYESFGLPEPGPGEALIRHRAIGVNMIDTYHRSGLYQVPLPTTLGVEAAGVIERLGPQTGELGLSEGQRVAYVRPGPGTYASAALAPAERLVPLPDDISDEVAAASLLKGLTVECLVRRVHAVRFGEPVLLHAAAGGVGSLALQWLSDIGAKVIATVGTDEKAELAKQNGADHVIVYTREDFKTKVRELYPEGVPVVYDSVGKATFEGSLDCLSARGLLVSYGNASGKPPPLELGTLAAKGSLFVTRPTLYSYTRTRQELLTAAAALFAMLQQKKLTPHISARFPLSETAAAHRALEARETTGQLLLIPVPVP